MKRLIVPVFVLALISILASGCGTASTVEAMAVVAKLNDFKEIVQVIEISGNWYSSNVTIDASNPEIQKHAGSGDIWCSHIIVYRTKTNTLRIASISANRPPNVTSLSQDFK